LAYNDILLDLLSLVSKDLETRVKEVRGFSDVTMAYDVAMARQGVALIEAMDGRRTR
jgi:hypothetical protein